MLTIHNVSDAATAFEYFKEKDDYYLSDAKSAEWWGRGAKKIGLVGDVRTKDLHAILAGRVAGEQVGDPGRHAAGWDMTFSCPKSVSIAALVLGDDRLTAAHDHAVRRALAAIEAHVSLTRQRDRQGGYVYRKTDGVAVGIFRHSTSRDYDPQVHSHCVIANVTHDPVSGKFVSLWSKDGIYDTRREAESVYMNELAAGARAAGYNVEWRVNDNGWPTFELAAISQRARDVYSQRKAGIDAALAQRGDSRETASAAARQAAALDTRNPKEHIPAAKLHHLWREKAADAGLTLEQLGRSVRISLLEERSAAAAKAVNAAVGHLSERQARFTQRELMVEARIASQGRAVDGDLELAIEAARRQGDLVDRQTLVRAPGGGSQIAPGLTTKMGASIETDMLRRADNIAAGGARHLKPGEQQAGENSEEVIDRLLAVAGHETGHRLTRQHRQAVRGVLCGHSGLHVVQGHAGTAKTSGVLAVVAQHARAGGWCVRAIAPTTSAAKTLGQAIKCDSATVAAAIAKDLPSSDKPQLWIVDEAGMISAADMRSLLRKADDAGARVVLVGDERQIGSVGAGRAFEQIKARQADCTYELTDIKRQRSAALRQAVYDSISGQAGAALSLVNVREQTDRARAITGIAHEYMRSTGGGHDTLVVTLSRADRADVNVAVQRRREAAGEVSKIREITTLADKQWTASHRADAARYKPGDVIQAHRRFAHLERGEIAHVVNVKDGRITVENAAGRQWTFDPVRRNAFIVLSKQQTRIGEGDRIITKGAVRVADDCGKALQLRNGSELRVDHIDGSNIDVTDTRGHMYRIDIRRGIRADLAYAQTANQAQGRTADSVIGYMRSSQTKLADQQRAYVTLSRARDCATIFTDSRSRLAQQIERTSGRKETALEDSAEAKVSELPRMRRASSAPAAGTADVGAVAEKIIAPGECSAGQKTDGILRWHESRGLKREGWDEYER